MVIVMKKLLIVDGNSILNRAYYGIRPLTTKEGIFTNAVYGMITILQKQLEAVQPDVCAIAFDRKEPTFRHKAYAEYKAGRHASPDELRMQFPYAKDAARAMGFAVLEQPGYEADDILGTLSKQANDAGDAAYLLTGDRDSLQLIGDKTTVLLATNKETVSFDRAQFVSVYGVQPEQFVDVKALMGDSSDNIPGVPGIGEKTALKLIADYHDLDALYDGLADKDIAKGAKAKLEAGRESAFFSRMLAAIVRDAPLDSVYADLPLRTEAFDREALRSLFVKLEFAALIRRLGLDKEDAEDAVSAPASITVSTPASAEEGTVPSPAVSASEPADPAPAGSPLPELPDDVFAVIPSEDGIYIRAKDGSRFLGFDDSLPALKDFFADKDKTLITCDCKGLYHLLDAHGIAFPEAAFDVMLAGYMLDPAESAYTPERLAVKYLGAILPENADGALLADTVYRLYPVMNAALREAGMENLYCSVELPLAHVLFRMETRGFKVDTAGLREYGDRLGEMCAEYEQRIRMHAGKEFNVNSPKQLGEVLFDTLALPCPSKKRTTNAETLEKLRPYHPIIGDILEYRQVSKLKSTYTDGLCKVADAEGRIHSSFNQTVTATGRLSSTEPNLQNIPIRTELGRALRRYFIASDDDHVLVDADYSQIELRLLAAISGDETMRDAFIRGTDIHTITASQVFGVAPSAVTPEMRKRAKAVNFGIVYGIGDYSLAMDIGVTKKQAAAYIDSYLRTYPKVQAYLKNVVEEAKRDGYVKTIYGRRRYIPELTATKKMTVAFGERVAMNSPIQGSAADIIKAAMVSLEHTLEKSGLDAHLILQVHDELIVECHKSCEQEVKEILRREMESVADLSVPLTVDVQAGENWFEGH